MTFAELRTRISLEPVRLIYEGLAPRERMLVLGAVALTGVVIVGVTLRSLHSAKVSMETRIEAKQRQLDEIGGLRDRLRVLEDETRLVYVDEASRPADFSLFSFLEGIGSRAMPREKITAMNPSSRPVDDEFREESVEMRISGVGLPEIVDLLYRVQTGPVPLRVSRLSMRKRFNDPYAFDLTLSVAMLLRNS